MRRRQLRLAPLLRIEYPLRPSGPFEVLVARLPTRVFGLLLLTVSLSVASCQAFVHSLPHVDDTPAIDQRDIHGTSHTPRDDLHGNV